MKTKRKVQLRSCSLCGRNGHNKASCKNILAETKVEKKAKPSQKINLSVNKKLVNKTVVGDSLVTKKVKSGKYIAITREVGNKPSPHVINLKKKEESIWDKIDIYQEKKVVKEKRAVVDFAEMVKVANATSSRKSKVESRKLLFQDRKVKKIKKPIRLPSFDFDFGFVFDFIDGIKNNFESGVRSLESAFRLFNYKKLAYSTIVLLIFASLPFPAIGYYKDVKDASARVVEASTNAFLSLQSSTVAAISANVDQAQFDLNSALVSFGEASDIVDREHTVLQYVAGLLPVVGKQVSSRQHLLTAGHHLALGNTYLVKGIREAENAEDLSLTDRFIVLANHLQSSIPQYKEALLDLSAVSESAVPVEYQQSFSDFKLLFATFIDDMTDLVELSRSLDSIFGSDSFKRYLLVFQNNHELRPTGGFMGSFAILDVQKGKIMNLDIPGGGTYDLQGQLDKYVKPPLPLQLSNKRWEFQDSNWYPDFPASAEKMEWFYEHGRGATVDGVIAINASVLERLLTILGPVSNEEHGITIASDNALSELQYEVEVDYDKQENKPKEVLSDLAPQFLESMGNLDAINAVRLLTELHEALGQKEIQVYFNDDVTQKKMESFGWGGEILENQKNQDYLNVISTNIQGQKSDAKINQTIEHQAIVGEDGSVINTVVITREHTGTPGEMFYGVNNVNYLRVYVPEGSELLEAGGFVYPPEDAFRVPENWYEDDVDLEKQETEVAIHSKTGTRITEEFGKTAFGNWNMVEPGQTSKIYFTYKLPFKVSLGKDFEVANMDKWKDMFTGQNNEMSRYSLIVQKQSGINSDFSSQIIYPDGWSPIWQENDNLELASNGAEFKTTLETDQVFGIIMEKKN